jgi:hypothetical protein
MPKKKMKARLIYVNTALGDDHLYRRVNNKIIVEWRGVTYDSAMSLNNFYRYLREGNIIKKSSPTVYVNNKRRIDIENKL